MPPPHLRRVADQGVPVATYELAVGEAFRLDAASFRVVTAEGGDVILPTVTARNPAGLVIAECSTAFEQVSPLDTTNPFAYTGPAAFGDAFSVQANGGYAGYVLHDFGAVPPTSQITITWPAPPAIRGTFSQVALRSAGAVTMGAVVGAGTAVESNAITVPLTAGIGAGNYALVHMTWIAPENGFFPDDYPAPTVTSSVAGNVTDFSGHATAGFAVSDITLANGLHLTELSQFLRVVNPLGIGDTITVVVHGFTVGWLHVNVHEVVGLTVGNPVGPVFGTNYTGFGFSLFVSPHTSTGLPTPIWGGGHLFGSVYALPAGKTVRAQFARGISDASSGFSLGTISGDPYVQARLPRLHLKDGDTVSAYTQDDTGLIRPADVVHDFHLWAVDDE